jgi:hypothetical protein
MSNKQQTAVEWYANRLCDIEIGYNQDVINTEVYIKSKTHAFEQAKEMEKEQIKNAHIEGQSCVHCPITELAEEFYNETYGGN